jgi:alkylation response protein AidB-like acyl-CoA dehydrogenase
MSSNDESEIPLIETPDSPKLDELCRRLSQGARELDVRPHWPAEQLAMCAQAGVYRWFVPESCGGFGWSEEQVIRGYTRLAAACLTTTFILTQFTAGCRRIVDSENHAVRDRLLPPLLDGRQFTTVGISHLTTSRRHLAKPVLRAEESADGFVLDGFSPWVTGAVQAQTIVVGATLPDGQQILIALPTDAPGVSIPAPLQLIGLTASCTGEVRCERVTVAREMLLAGPDDNVMAGKTGAKTGGLQTSALAVGASAAAIDFIAGEAQRRPDLKSAVDEFRAEHAELETDLFAAAAGRPIIANESLRARANSLVLRSAQGALVAAKGTGYVVGHPAGRWCREALFFLVWSCPQPVSAANLCELAGLEGFST